ncbi:MAG: type 1 glutamine amidotransferase [Bowdeniella nasicola]|nr:type 1 glutamine amidotransferase [Bowdeniella nasicola]
MRPHVTVIQLDDDAPLSHLHRDLRDAGLAVDIVDGIREAIPERARDGLIVLGGGANAYADTEHPHLPAVRALLRDAVEHDIPTLGICLGAQLLCVAFGGRVAVADARGLEAGPIEVRLTEEGECDPVLGAVPGCFLTASWHGDALVRPPEGARWLAASATYPQALRIGSALGVQFHPEVGPDDVERWAATRAGMDPAAIRAALEAVAHEVRASGSAIARAFAIQVRGCGTNSVE